MHPTSHSATAGDAPVQRVDAAPEQIGALIDYILARYHAVHRQKVPALIVLARRVEAAHRDHQTLPAGLADLLTSIAWEMEAHMQKEEQGLFPMLRDGHGGMAVAMELMRDEHDDHAARPEQLAALSRGHRHRRMPAAVGARSTPVRQSSRPICASVCALRTRSCSRPVADEWRVSAHWGCHGLRPRVPRDLRRSGRAWDRGCLRAHPGHAVAAGAPSHA
jgi:hypothetical protein